MTIRRAAQRWFVSFSCMVTVEPPAAPDKPAIGIAVGLQHFATLSDGTHTPNPGHVRRGAAVLARRQQAVARKKPGSRNRHRAKMPVARAPRKVRAQRRDCHPKTARQSVRRHGAIAVEGLRVATIEAHAL